MSECRESQDVVGGKLDCGKNLAPLVLALISLLVLVLDQWTKHLALTKLKYGETVAVIDGLFNFTLVYNPGAAFGMFGNLPETQRQIVLAVVSVLALCVVFWYLRGEAKGDPYSQVALMGILGGALGNIIDRFRFDAVVDFLDFYYQSYHWPAFNIADSAISVGVAVLILRMFIAERKAKKGQEIE